MVVAYAKVSETERKIVSYAKALATSGKMIKNLTSHSEHLSSNIDH